MTDDSDEEFTRADAVRDVVRGAGVVYVGLVLEMGLAFLAQRFAAVHLSIAGFGSLLSGTALLSLGSIVGGLGLSAGLRRYLPRVGEPARRSLTSYAFLLSIPASVAVAVPTVVFADVFATRVFGDPDVAVSLRIFGAAIPFATALNVAIGGIQGQKVSRFRVYVKNLLQPGARFGLVMLAVFVGAGQLGFAAGYAVPFALAAALAAVLLYRTFPSGGDSARARETLPELVRYSLPFTVSGLASFVYRSIDIFLILYLLDSRAVGAYGVAYALARLIAVFSTSFSFLSSPVSSQLESQDRVDEAVTVQTTVARWLTIVSIGATVPMVLFARTFLASIYRPAYATAGLTLAVLAVGFALKNVLLTHGPILEALGKSKVSAFNTVTAAVINLVANLALIPRYGIEGAAAATTLSFVALGVLPAVEVRHYTGETTISRDVLAPAALAVPVVAVATPALGTVPRTLPWALAASTLFAVSYAAAVVVVLGFSEADVMIVRSIEDRFGVSLGPFDAVLRRFS